MLGPFATASRLTPIHQGSLAVLSRAACASMSTRPRHRQRQRQRVTEGTAMARWNGRKNSFDSYCLMIVVVLYCRLDVVERIVRCLSTREAAAAVAAAA